MFVTSCLEVGLEREFQPASHSPWRLFSIVQYFDSLRTSSVSCPSAAPRRRLCREEVTLSRLWYRQSKENIFIELCTIGGWGSRSKHINIRQGRACTERTQALYLQESGRIVSLNLLVPLIKNQPFISKPNTTQSRLTSRYFSKSYELGHL